MKKIFITVFFLTATVFLLSAMSLPSKTEKESLVGTVAYYGNVPFEFLGIKTDDGKLYKLEIGENCRTPEGKTATESDISKLQGRKIKFIGETKKDSRSNSTLYNIETFIVEAYNVQKSN